MKNRFFSIILIMTALVALVAPSAIAADLASVGYIDQSALGSLPVFVRANQQLSAYQAQLNQRFASAMHRAKDGAERQRIYLQYHQEFSDKQQELIGPLFERAQLAIANVAAAHKLSIVVDKRIIVYGGINLTKEVVAEVRGPSAIQPPQSSPPPSPIGFVDESALDSAQKVKTANSAFQAFEQQQQPIYAKRLKDATNDVQKQQIMADYNTAMQKKRDQLLDPLVKQTKAVTASIAQKKNLLLVIDRADVIYGGTDITQDVQNALNS
jgi:outer membrane protein